MEELLPWPEYRWDEIQEVLDEFHSLLSERVPRLRIERQEDVLDWEQQTGVYLLFGPNEERGNPVSVHLFGNPVSVHLFGQEW